MEQSLANVQKTTKGILEKYKSSMNAVLPKSMTIERINGIVYEAVRSKPDAMVKIFTTSAGQASFVSAVIRSAKIGLAPDGVVAAIVPRRIKNVWLANFEPMWRGLAILAYNSGQVKAIRGDYVFAEDEWEHEDGLFVKLRHVKAKKKDRGSLVAAWCVVETTLGGLIPKVVYEFDVDRARQGVTHSSNPYAAENMWAPEMWRKTAYKQALATAPMSDELRAAIASDDQGLAIQSGSEEIGAVIDIDPVQVVGDQGSPDMSEEEMAMSMGAEAGARAEQAQQDVPPPQAEPPKEAEKKENVQQAPEQEPAGGNTEKKPPEKPETSARPDF